MAASWQFGGDNYLAANVKGCVMPAPYAAACALILPSRAGVAQAPKEETAAYFAAVAKAMGI